MLFVECIALYRVRVMEVVFRCIRPAGFDQYPLPPPLPYLVQHYPQQEKAPSRGLSFEGALYFQGLDQAIKIK